MEIKIEKLIYGVALVIIVAVAFYNVFPKYEFLRNGVIRCNRITGRVDIFDEKELKWQEISKRFKQIKVDLKSAEEEKKD